MNEQMSFPEADVERQLQRLRSAEVDVPKDWRTGIDPAVTHPGECFVRACHYATQLWLRLPAHVEIFLVHGEYGLSTAHAWVELGGAVAEQASRPPEGRQTAEKGSHPVASSGRGAPPACYSSAGGAAVPPGAKPRRRVFSVIARASMKCWR